MSQTVNVLVLNNQEEIIGWLHPELVEIVEYNDVKGIQSIIISHPLNDETGNNYLEWLKHGNKIWLSENEDLKSCLYIINADKETDQDMITISAEEVIVELNNVEVIENKTTTPINITKTILEGWFNKYFTIRTVEAGNLRNDVTFTGTLTPLQLLRMIEEKTGNYFITDYRKDLNSNKIYRYLDFKKKLGVTHNKPIELGINTNKIEEKITEDDTFTAISPVIKDNAEGGGGFNDTVNMSKVLDDYRNMAISKGQSIPMIIEKKDDGSSVVKAYWYAPFNKSAGSYMVYSTDVKSDYNRVREKEGSQNTIYKTGIMETGETNKYIIYNNCALKLMDKLEPVINIEVDLQDLRRLQGLDETYNVGDEVYIKLPSGSLFKSIVNSTEKNPRLIGESKIKIGNDVTRAYSNPSDINRKAVFDELTLSSIYQSISNKTQIKHGSVTVANVTANTKGIVSVPIEDNVSLNRFISWVSGGTMGTAQFEGYEGNTFRIAYKFDQTQTNRTIHYAYW